MNSGFSIGECFSLAYIIECLCSVLRRKHTMHSHNHFADRGAFGTVDVSITTVESRDLPGHHLVCSTSFDGLGERPNFSERFSCFHD